MHNTVYSPNNFRRQFPNVPQGLHRDSHKSYPRNQSRRYSDNSNNCKYPPQKQKNDKFYERRHNQQNQHVTTI